MFSARCFGLLGLLVFLGGAAVLAAEQPAAPSGPAYQIILRSRHAVASPLRTKDAQTGGGSILVEQAEPHTVVVTMGGSVVAGSELHCSTASIDFNLLQHLDIIPMRSGLRAPRVGMVGRVVGTLQVTDPRLCKVPCGSADQGPATAGLVQGETCLLSIGVEPSSAACGQEMSIN